MQNEVWIPIKDFETYYEVSDMGRVRSLERIIKRKDGFDYHINKNEITGAIDKKGYLRVCLSKFNKNITLKRHRLVAQAFIANPENKPQVNHINGIKSDNRVENLEWCTNSENQIHSYRKLNRKNILIGKIRNCSLLPKNVIQCSLDGFVVNIFDSIKGASIKTGVIRKRIEMCLKGKKYSSDGYLWL